MTQFSDLQDRVLRYGFADSKYRPDVGNWLNEGQRKIAAKTNMRLFFESMEITTSLNYTGLPADFLRLHPTDAVNISTNETDWNLLEALELRDFDDAPVTYGTPTSYTVAGHILYLYPYPDSEISIVIVYYRLPTDMSSDTDEPEISEVYEDVMVSWALKRAYEREQDFEAAGYHGADFDGGLNNLMGQLQTDTEVSPRQIPGMWGDIGQLGVRLP